jgi:hypothetical protein
MEALMPEVAFNFCWVNDTSVVEYLSVVSYISTLLEQLYRVEQHEGRPSSNVRPYHQHRQKDIAPNILSTTLLDTVISALS